MVSGIYYSILPGAAISDEIVQNAPHIAGAAIINP
jgi:hypothetical protein